MRLSYTPATACLVLATLCLASITTTTTTNAFVAPTASLRTSVPTAKGFARTRCNAGPVPMRMKLENQGGSKRVAFRDAAANLLFGRRDSRAIGQASATEKSEGRTGGIVAGKQRRAGGLVRKGVAAVATAVVLRSSFQPKPASAIMFKLRGQSAAQQTLERQKQEAMRQEQLTDEDEIAFFEREMAGETEDGASAAAGAAGAVAGELLETGEEEGSYTEGVEASANGGGFDEGAGGQKTKMKVKERAAKLKSEVATKDFNPNTIEVASGRLKTYGFAIVGVIATYNAVSSYSGSTDIMGRQRRRIKVESAKFDQQKEEFMDVEGEVEVDVDMMKELRDLKETMAGPGDKYAKDTRKYNPEFAAANPEEDYDSKLDEVLGRKKKDPDDEQTFGKTGIVFSREESKGPKRIPNASSKDNAKADDLLEGDESDTTASAKSEVQGGGGDGGDAQAAAAAAAMQAKKDADVKRLSELFKNSPSEDTEDDGDASPEDDQGDDRELLP